MRKIFIALFLFLCIQIVSEARTSFPEMTGYKVWEVSGVEFENSDFSGIVAAFDNNSFVTVFNSAGMYYMEIPKDGDTVLSVKPLWAINSQFAGGKRDMEAVTVNRKTGDIYYTQERATVAGGSVLFKGNTLYKLEYPGYDKEYEVFTFPPEMVPDNNYTLEGCAWIRGDEFLIGREGDKKGDFPPAIIEYVEGKGVKRIVDVTSWTKQIAAICYDKEGGCLWITDSDYDKKLYRVKASGNYEVINSYDISFIENGEGIYVDRQRGCVWIASDERPSKLYRLDFKNL